MTTPKDLLTTIIEILAQYDLRDVPAGDLYFLVSLQWNRIEAIIKDHKSEWLFEFLTWYCDKYEMTFTYEFKRKLISTFLNAPEPE